MPKLAVIAVAIVAAMPAPALAGTPDEDLGWLNLRRSADGIPGDIVRDQGWSQACAAHLRYVALTGSVGHAEDPRSPWYTPEGAWAGTNAVLAVGVRWEAFPFLWETAPLHLAQLLSPALQRSGIADDGRSVCVTTWPGYTRPVPAGTTVLTSPGEASGVPPSISTEEWPITPAAAVGLSNPTGPHLYVYQWGPATVSGVDAAGEWIGIRSASLRGTEGLVPVRWVDRRNPRVGPYLPVASGIVIPARPLRSPATYVARVVFTNGVERTWSFVTDARASAYVLRRLRVRPSDANRRRVCVRRVDGACVASAIRYRVGVGIAGRIVRRDTGEAVAGAGVIVRCGAIETPRTTTRWDGGFTATCRVTPTRRRFRIVIAIRDEGTIAAARIVRMRIVPGPTGVRAQVISISNTVYPYAPRGIGVVPGG